jgi:hypothetical protein
MLAQRFERAALLVAEAIARVGVEAIQQRRDVPRHDQLCVRERVHQEHVVAGGMPLRHDVGERHTYIEKGRLHSGSLHAVRLFVVTAPRGCIPVLCNRCSAMDEVSLESHGGECEAGHVTLYNEVGLTLWTGVGRLVTQIVSGGLHRRPIGWLKRPTY